MSLLLTTAAVTDMAWMFEKASAFNQDLSSWDTAAVTDMWGMFSGASAFNQDLSSWDTAAVTRMEYMFNGASTFNQDLSSWDTAAVTGMDYMFNEASAFNQDLSSWDVMAVVNNKDMWTGATAMTDEMHKPCTATGVGADGTTTWRACAFRDRAALKAALGNCLAVDPTGVNCRHDGIPISDWDVSRVTDMNDLFRGAAEFNADISKWNTAAVTRMDLMFLSASELCRRLRHRWPCRACARPSWQSL